LSRLGSLGFDKFLITLPDFGILQNIKIWISTLTAGNHRHIGLRDRGVPASVCTKGIVSDGSGVVW
jgi:hypothetical protein